MTSVDWLAERNNMDSATSKLQRALAEAAFDPS
jgi:hypothetical protein